MTIARPNLLLATPQDPQILQSDLDRLGGFADWGWLVADESQASDSAALREILLERVADVDGIVVWRRKTQIDAEVMDRAPKLRIGGDLHGDRFAHGIDLEAAWERSIRVIDTTNGSSYPVSEWALGLILVSLRNAGAHFRNIITDRPRKSRDDPGYMRGELTGKRVGLIGCGHIGRRLLQLLQPFHVEVWAYDPYLPRELPEVLGILSTSLENVLSQCDAIVCLAPITPRTKGMIGRRELELIPPGAVLVNVSRGKVIDSQALVERLERGDIIAGLDVFDPDPVPAGHPITAMPNVFLTPHIAGVTAKCGERFFTLMVDELERFFHGHDTYFDLTPRSRANRLGGEVPD